ncbi:hypothetical protein K1719_042356 [Acacia pycnantha]|nr:hypothetical protein K1719_042356 [Acacia pycnantha]
MVAKVLMDDWYIAANNGIRNQPDIIREITFSPNFADQDNLLLNPVDSSSLGSPSNTVFNNLDPSQLPYFLPPPKPTLPSLLNVAPSNNPLDHGFDVGYCLTFLEKDIFQSLHNPSKTFKVLFMQHFGVVFIDLIKIFLTDQTRTV